MAAVGEEQGRGQRAAASQIRQIDLEQNLLSPGRLQQQAHWGAGAACTLAYQHAGVAGSDKAERLRSLAGLQAGVQRGACGLQRAFLRTDPCHGLGLRVYHPTDPARGRFVPHPGGQIGIQRRRACTQRLLAH